MHQECGWAGVARPQFETLTQNPFTMKNRMKIWLWWLIPLCCLCALDLRAQDDQALLAQLDEEERKALEALVLYPEDTRQAILECSQYPEVLVKLTRLQSQTRASFQDLLETYPQDAQAVVWDVTRYPDLVRRLAVEGGRSSSRIEGVLRDYPEEVHENARLAGTNHYDLLLQIDELQASANRAFAALLRDYPPEMQAAMRQLVELPEVLDILTENIELAVLVGSIYGRNPKRVLQVADSLSLEVARANARELEDWKEALENDPQAMEELRAAAQEYADEYGYDDAYYGYADDDLYYAPRPRPQIVEHHYYYSYPYWFGYPYWYSYPRWRPYPYWYDWGFYFGPGQTIVIIQLPSFYYTRWYFYQPRRHYYYPYLSAHFVRHYRRHQYSGSSVSTTVAVWQRSSRGVIPPGWIQDDQRLPDRMREYGRFEMDRSRYNQQNPSRTLQPREFLVENSRRYPDLTQANRERLTTERGTYQEPVPAPRTQPPVREPDIRPPAQRQPEARPRTVPRPPAERPRTERAPATPPPAQRQQPAPQTRERPAAPPPRPAPQTPPRSERNQVPQVERGRDYHRNTWENTRSPQQTTPRTPAPTRPSPPSQRKNEPAQKRGGN
jgi:hypothetical protein